MRDIVDSAHRTRSPHPSTRPSIRSGFPSLRDGRVYLDNPGGTQVHRSVYDAVADYYASANANLGGPFETSVASDRILADARAQVAAFLGAGAPTRSSSAPT